MSGGQTGADRGGLDAGLELGLEIGGFCPRGRRAEDGRIPDRYPVTELDTPAYPARTRKNVESSDATVVFSRGAPDRGSALTIRLAERARKPVLAIDVDAENIHAAAARLESWLAATGPTVLNVAGSRDSNAPGIGDQVRAILTLALGAQRRD